MKRLSPIIAIVALMTGACSKGSIDTTSTPPPRTTTTAETTTTTTAETTTTTASADAATGDGEPLYVTLSDTPPDRYDSYTATFESVIESATTITEIQSEGTWVSGQFSCDTTVTVDRVMSYELRAVSTPNQIWLDTGFGPEESSLDDGDTLMAITACPASPIFWEQLIPFYPELFDLTPTTTKVNHIPVQRYDLSEDGEIFASRLGLITGSRQYDVDTLTVWIPEIDNDDAGAYPFYPVAIEFVAAIHETVLNESGIVHSSGQIAMRFELAYVNDPDLAIDLPQVGAADVTT